MKITPVLEEQKPCKCAPLSGPPQCIHIPWRSV